MRSFLLLAFIVGLAMVAVIRPKTGVYSIVWFALMRPDVWAWSTTQYPYASILELGTLVGSLKYLNLFPPLLRNPVCRLLLILQVPILISIVMAIHPSLCWEPYRWYLGCVISSFLIAMHIQTEADFRKLLVVAALSIGYLGARFGLYGLIHGGVRFAGGYGASLSDNNTLALALAMGIPLGWYGMDLIRSTPVRLSLLVSVFLTIAAVIFTFSRGAALSVAAIFIVVILHSRHRFFLTAALVVLTVPSMWLVKDSYFGRMETLKNTKADQSAQERVENIRMAKMMWHDYPIAGVGFGTKNQRSLWFRYASAAGAGGYALVIHNTYLQMLVDSGTPALLAYVTLLFGTIILMERSSRRLKRAGSPLYQCPLAIEAGLIGFAVGSTFLTRITFDFSYILLMMGASWLIVEPQHLESLREEQDGEDAEADPQLVEA